MRTMWGCVGLGAILCVGLDALHVASGTTYYARPVWFGLAWWAPLLFLGASLGMLTGVRLFGAAPLPHQPRQTLADGLAFVAAYASTSFLGGAPVALALTLLAFWAARVMTLPGWVGGWSVLVAVVGSLAEILLSGAGQFGYHRPDVLGIPWWLPMIYLHAGVFAARLDGLVMARRS
jgi:hypothetical protein